MKPIRLSICISALAQRNDSLAGLIDSLVRQPRFHECELIVIMDSGQMQTGSKRNRVLDAAQGEFVCCIDDDDRVAADYIPAILNAIEAGEDVDAILIDGVQTQASGKTVYFDYELDGIEGRWSGDKIWRSPGHLCPIRTTLARLVAFPQPTRGEDLAWSAELRVFLKTARRAASRFGAMYYYMLDPSKSTPRTLHVNRTHQEIFTPQYVSKSGPGSTVGFSQPYRKFVESFIASGQGGPIKTIIDLGCGDMTVMGNVELRDVEYIGVDVIAARIEQNRKLYEHREDMTFACEDLRRFTLEADLILCKDVLQHWSTGEIAEWLERLKSCSSQFRYALITNCNYGPTVNQAISTGGWRALDLTKPPFNIGERVFQFGDSIGGFKDVVMIKGTK